MNGNEFFFPLRNENLISAKDSSNFLDVFYKKISGRRELEVIQRINSNYIPYFLRFQKKKLTF